MINMISSMILPIFVLLIILYGIKKNVPIFDTFIEGSKESFDIVLTMFPCLLGMIFGVNIFFKSGILSQLFLILEPLFNYIKIPTEVLPMIILRPISGSASIAILNSIFTNYGPDSMIGNLASVIQGSTDTTLYILTLYFGSVGIKKIRYSLWAGLFADLVGIISAIIIVNTIL